VAICESSSSVVQIEQFGCKDVKKMVGVLAVLLYLLNGIKITNQKSVSFDSELFFLYNK
jgi:hypothetical protein